MELNGLRGGGALSLVHRIERKILPEVLSRAKEL